MKMFHKICCAVFVALIIVCSGVYLAPESLNIFLNPKHVLDNAHAHDDLSVNEWKPRYYVAHVYSPAGLRWRFADVGEVFSIDEKQILIEGKFIDEYGSANDDYATIRKNIPDYYYCFQTCYNENSFVVLYGRNINV